MTRFFTPRVMAFLWGVSVSVLILTAFFAGALADRIFVIKPLDAIIRRAGSMTQTTGFSPTPGSVAHVAETASQAVVTVAIKRQQSRVSSLEDILGRRFILERPDQTEEVRRDIGTGFVVDETGLVVTNRHVVSNPAGEYVIIDKDNHEHAVTNIYRDPANDLAILKVETLPVTPLSLGDSDQLKVGQEVIAIGTALGEFRHTVTTGVVSGLGRGIEAGSILGQGVESLEGVIQTDAAINPGNSGGPLLDDQGRVIGVNVAMSPLAQNIGFAIPINVVKASLDHFQRTGQFDRPFLGIRYQVVRPAMAIQLGVPAGALLGSVVPGSAAQEGGLQAGDIILEFDGQSLADTELSVLINNKQIGDQVTVKYWREGQENTLTLTLRGGS